MEALGGFLSRRRWLVVGAWVAVVIVALPLASKQTENLTGGGFDVPGSESAAVESSLAGFKGADDGQVGVVLEAEPSATEAQIDAAIARVDDAVAKVPEFTLPAGSDKLIAGELSDNG